jgi:hypothetical protein
MNRPVRVGTYQCKDTYRSRQPGLVVQSAATAVPAQVDNITGAVRAMAATSGPDA